MSGPNNYQTPTFTENHNPKRAIVVGSGGGLCSEIHRLFLDVPNAIKFDFDSPSEHAQRRHLHREFDVTAIALAEGETISSLFEGSNHPAEPLIALCSDSSAKDGIGAIAAGGDCAMDQRVVLDDFRSQLRHLRAQIISMTGGELDEIVVLWFIGEGGATGSGSIIRAISEFERELSSLGVPVRVQIYVIGAIAFAGVSEVAELNSPCVRAALIDFVTQKAPPKVVRSLQIAELPPRGRNAQSLRSLLINIDHQALSSNALQQHLDRLAPNKATASPLGNITVRDFQIFASQESLSSLPACAAKKMLKLLEPLMDVKLIDPAIISSEEWLDKSVRVTCDSVDELVHLYWREAQTLKSLVVNPETTHDYLHILNLSQIGQMDACKIDHYCARPLQSESDIRFRQTLLNTLGKRFSIRLTQFEHQQASLFSTIKVLLPKIDVIVKGIANTGNDSKKLKLIEELRQLLRQIRDHSERQYATSSKIACLKLASAMVAEEMRSLKDVLSYFKSCLAECISTIGPSSSEDLVATHTITDALKHLNAMPTLQESQRIARLNRLACFVTRKGLQLITGAINSRIESLADAIVYGTPTYRSPPLGAKAYTEVSSVIYVLPRMEQEDAEALAAAIRTRDDDALVFFTDTIGCGAAVVKYHFRRFRTVESLFPGIARRDLERALASEHVLLRFPHGYGFLQRLGIHFDANTKTVRFEDRPLVRE